MLFDLAPAATRLPGFPVTALIFVALVVGMCLRLGWLALGLAQLTRYRRTARRIEALPRGIQEIATRLGVAPEFRLTKDIQGPVTFGLRRPVILIPLRFMELDAGRQQVIATHELLHVVRRDWVLNLAEEIVLAAFWFHPVVWWLVGRIRLSREQVVDCEVVEMTGARKPYLYALVEIAAGPGAVRSLVAPAFLNECQLAERIRTLIKGDLMSKRRIIISLACVVVLTLLVGLAIIRKFPLKTVAPPLATSNPIQVAPEVFAVGNGVTAPVPIYKPEPGYTKEARAAKLEGTVVLWIVVAADGMVSDVKVTKPFDKGLDENAVQTVKTWKFKPAMRNGVPVPVKVMVEVSFKLF
jgi:TonB family protein